MDFSRALDTMRNMLDGIIAGLPDFVLAILIFAIFYLVAKRMRRMVARITEQRRRGKNLGVVLGKLTQGVVVVAGVLIALTVIFPSFQPNDLIQLLGIGSVAIGFAFHDLFQNFLAGILLLITSPFQIGDQIVVQQFEGTVEDIEMRATTIKTYDGRRVVIPNTDLFTNSVTVNTAFQKRRLEHVISVSNENDIDEVKGIILDALSSLDGVLEDPPPETLVVGFSDSSIDIHVQWWTTTSRQAEVLYLQDKVLTALKKRLDSKDIPMPTMTQHILLQRLTETQKQKHTAEALQVPLDGKVV
jgi:small conductance mechanosensitive channel